MRCFAQRASRPSPARGTERREPARQLCRARHAGRRAGDVRDVLPEAARRINNGRLPDTIRDRSIVIALERQRPDDRAADLFPDELADDLAELRARLEDWAAASVEPLAAWRRDDRIEQLGDRLQEAWDPLLAIAELAGDDWPKRAREAARALASGAEDAGDEAHGHLLLVALRGIFDQQGDLLSSHTICEQLNADEELPFGGYGDGNGITPRGVAKLLKPYGIKPKVVRTGDQTPRGYERVQFAEAWERYAHNGASGQAQQAQHAQHPNGGAGFDLQRGPQQVRNGPSDVADNGSCVADAVAHENPDEQRDVADVADVAANGRPARAHRNGCVPRDPFCRYTEHRPSDWALAGATTWTCGVCHPPAASLLETGELVYRNGQRHDERVSA